MSGENKEDQKPTPPPETPPKEPGPKIKPPTSTFVTEGIEILPIFKRKAPKKK